MIPILFSKTETAFTSNGIGRLTDCISCSVTEERNGIYECEFEYPITGKWYNKMITNGGIIGVIHDDNHDIQPFDIYKHTAPIDGVVTFNAHHISYRLNNIILQPFTAGSASAAIGSIVTNSVNTNPFTFTTDKTVTAQFNLQKPASVRSILFGEEGSLLDVYGTAEYKFDKWTVSMLLHRGTDTGVTVRFGKNMTDIERTSDDSETFNAIAPYWSDGTNYVYPTAIIVQPTSPLSPVKPVVMDVSDKFETQPSKAQVAAAARSYLDSNEPWQVDDNISVNFIALWQTPEYENIASIQRVGLCDTVSVYYTEMGIVAEKKEVIRVVYDVLGERFEEMELGTPSRSYVAIDNGSGQSATISIDQALNGKVNRTGDTMTGPLVMDNTTISVTNTGYATSDVPPASSLRYIYFKDKNNDNIGYFGANISQNSFSGLVVTGGRQVNGAQVENIFGLYVDNTGKRVVDLNAPEAWLEELGVLESETSISNIASAGTRFTITSASYKAWGKVAQVVLNMKCTTAAGSGTNIATINSGKRPSIIASATIRDGGVTVVNTGGSIPSPKAYAVDDTFTVCATYILA